MRFGVISSRSWKDGMKIETTLYEFDLEYHVMAVLGGSSPGADMVVRDYCATLGIPYIVFKPYFMVDHKAARDPRHFFMRSKQIVDNSDHLIFFWDGESKGTSWAINYAKKKGKPMNVYLSS